MNTTTRRISKLASALLLATAAIVAAPTAANAATSTSFCVKGPAGSIYYGAMAANMPVDLINSSTGAVIRSGSSGATGCGTFSGVPSNLNLRIRVNRTVGNANIGWATYVGATPLIANAGYTGPANLGTINLSLQCRPGNYAYCAGQAG